MTQPNDKASPYSQAQCAQFFPSCCHCSIDCSSFTNILLSVNNKDVDWSSGGFKGWRHWKNKQLVQDVNDIFSYSSQPRAESHVSCYSWLTIKATPLSGFPECMLPWQRGTPFFSLSQPIVFLPQHCSCVCTCVSV